MMSFNFVSAIVFALILSVAKTNSDWDYIVFTQSWPSTTCIEWKDASAAHYCTLPKDWSHWIVHGLWPTKIGGSGPNFCKMVDFNETALLPILEKLDESWTNVEMPTDRFSFWRHEWLKHGSCAESVPRLDSELKYFSEGLTFVEKYNINQMLADKGIVAGDKPYSSRQIYNAVVSAVNRTPSIHCVRERGTGKIFLSEIRLCLDKDLEVIDCEGGTEEIVQCGVDSQEDIHYPSTVPKVRDYSLSPPSSHWLYKVLYLLRLLVWFSL